MKTIGDIREIEDLVDGETAKPEADMGYELRTIAGRFERGTVVGITRRGNRILATTTNGREFAVTGPNAHVLVPLSF
ncbi:hypothetical protein SV7mr_31400 [Stieleria bergensis]|uniref:Uncharacterized protein n=2 Tax=Pirellulaceae TaxID=2691357 RepID=A0A5B1CEE5_9BACT|nr:hypothetical protein [Rubripirellula obstinata]KAA1258129.1 hypothetical protein LF1_06440 [Rubripirellula obstinata]QDT60616.1 hypothetical protein SV7mr_31400 [Planctomycetes bacterium SV_7m_r]